MAPRPRFQAAAVSTKSGATLLLLLLCSAAVQGATLRGSRSVVGQGDGGSKVPGLVATIVTNFLLAAFKSFGRMTVNNPKLELVCQGVPHRVVSHTVVNSSETVALAMPEGASMHVSYESNDIKLPQYENVFPQAMDGDPLISIGSGKHFWQTLTYTLTTSNPAYNDRYHPSAYCLRMIVAIEWTGISISKSTETFKWCTDSILVKIGGTTWLTDIRGDPDKNLPSEYLGMLHRGVPVATVRELLKGNTTRAEDSVPR